MQLGRNPAGLRAHDDALDEHLAGQLLGELGPQPTHVGAQLGELAELLTERGQRDDVVPERGHPGHLIAQRGERREVGAQLRDPRELLTQSADPGEVLPQCVELRAHRLLGLAAQLALQLQLVLAARSDLPLQLELVGAAELGLARAGGHPVGGPPAAGKGGEDERPGDADDGQAEELRVVGEEHHEGGRDGQREAARLEQRPLVGDPGARSDVVLALRHGPSVAADRTALRTETRS